VIDIQLFQLQVQSVKMMTHSQFSLQNTQPGHNLDMTVAAFYMEVARKNETLHIGIKSANIEN